MSTAAVVLTPSRRSRRLVRVSFHFPNSPKIASGLPIVFYLTNTFVVSATWGRHLCKRISPYIDSPRTDTRRKRPFKERNFAGTSYVRIRFRDEFDGRGETTRRKRAGATVLSWQCHSSSPEWGPTTTASQFFTLLFPPRPVRLPRSFRRRGNNTYELRCRKKTPVIERFAERFALTTVGELYKIK